MLVVISKDVRAALLWMGVRGLWRGVRHRGVKEVMSVMGRSLTLIFSLREAVRPYYCIQG